MNLNESGIGIKDKLDLLTACEEIIVNISNYAYSPDTGNLIIIYSCQPGKVIISFIDSGNAFNPTEKPDVDTSLPLDEREAGGLGIFMVKMLVDEVTYEYKENKNCLVITKYIT